MNELVKYNRPANARRGERVTLVAGRPERIRRDLRRMLVDGTAADVSPVYLITSGARAGQYAVDVTLVERPVAAKAPRPRWAGPLIVFGALLASAAGMLLLVVWVLTSLSAAVWGGVLLAALAVLGALTAAGRHGSSVTVTTTTRVDIS